MAWIFNPFTGKLDNTGAGGGVSTFLGLTDTPSSYVSQSGKMAVVNTGETALEFVSAVQEFDGGNFSDTYVDAVNFDAGAF